VFVVASRPPRQQGKSTLYPRFTPDLHLIYTRFTSVGVVHAGRQGLRRRPQEEPALLGLGKGGWEGGLPWCVCGMGELGVGGVEVCTRTEGGGQGRVAQALK
jgi:hypothetical protein